MFDDDCEAFREDIRAALAAAARPVDPQRDAMRRLVSWLKTSPAEEFRGGDKWDAEDEDGVAVAG